MAHYHSTSSIQTTIRFCLLFSLLVGMVSAQLSSNFYATSCPNALSTIKTAVDSAVSSEKRMGASLLRLHFHDCFVNASPSLSLSLSLECFKDIFNSNAWLSKVLYTYSYHHMCELLFIYFDTHYILAPPIFPRKDDCLWLLHFTVVSCSYAFRIKSWDQMLLKMPAK